MHTHPFLAHADSKRYRWTCEQCNQAHESLSCWTTATSGLGQPYLQLRCPVCRKVRSFTPGTPRWAKAHVREVPQLT